MTCAWLVRAVIEECGGTLRLSYSKLSKQVWRQMGLTLSQRDRAVECLLAKGLVTLRLTSKGVDVSLT